MLQIQEPRLLKSTESCEMYPWPRRMTVGSPLHETKGSYPAAGSGNSGQPGRDMCSCRGGAGLGGEQRIPVADLADAQAKL